MSQIASFTFLRASDVSFLGFWSKPKPRLFRKPIGQFSDFLRQHALREMMFDGADGVYVALVFAWLETIHRAAHEEDPVIRTVRKNIGGSHWLIKHPSSYTAAKTTQHFQPEDLQTIATKFGIETEFQLEMTSVYLALSFVEERLAEVTTEEALLVSIG